MKSRTLLVAALGAVLALGTAVGLITIESEGTAASSTGPGGPNDALTAARFSLTIDGVEIAQFAQLEGIVSGLDRSELELASKGGGVVLKLPGKRMPPTVTLKRGMTRSLELAAWHELAMSDNEAARKNVTLVVYEATGDPVARYHLENAWPSKLVVDALAAGASQVLFETVTLVAEHVQRVSP